MRLVIPGRPVPAARPRVTRGHAYYPAKYRDWLAAAAWHVKVSGGKLAGPVTVTLRFCRDQTVIEVAEGGPPRPKGLRFDLDNAAKGCLDSLVAGGVLADDRQVTMLHVMFDEEEE